MKASMIWLKDWQPVIGMLFQVAFYAAIGIVTTLTYLRAKRTLLQPFKTKVFEEQLKAVSAVLALFEPYSDHNKRVECALQKLAHANSAMLIDTYAYHNLHAVSSGEKAYSRDKCPIEVFTIEAVNAHFRLCDGHLRDEDRPTVDPSRPADILSVTGRWSDFSFDGIRVPAEWQPIECEIKQLMASPFVPQACVDLIAQYYDTLQSNTETLRGLLTECAHELPAKYPDLETLRMASLDWIHSRWIRARVLPEEHAKAITAWARAYFQSDDVFG